MEPHLIQAIFLGAHCGVDGSPSPTQTEQNSLLRSSNEHLPLSPVLQDGVVLEAGHVLGLQEHLLLQVPGCRLSPLINRGAVLTSYFHEHAQVANSSQQKGAKHTPPVTISALQPCVLHSGARLGRARQRKMPSPFFSHGAMSCLPSAGFRAP